MDVYLPNSGVGLRHPDNPDPSAEPPEVHRAAQLPVVGLRVVLLDCLEVGRPVEAAHSEELPVDHGKADAGTS